MAITHKGNFLFIFKEFPILFLLFLIISGLGGTISFYIGLSLMPIILLKTGFKLKVSKELFWLIIFSFSYAIISTLNGYNDNSKGNIVFYAIFPPVCYMIGKYLMTKWDNQFFFIVLFLIVSLSLLTFNDVFLDINKNGFINYSRAIETSNGNPMSATLRGALVSIPIAMIALVIVPTKNIYEKRFKYIYIIIGILGAIVILHLINRTGLIIIIISFLLTFFNNIIKSKHKKQVIIFLILLIFIVIFLSKYFELDSVFNAYQMREVDPEYGTVTGGGRLERWLNTLIEIFENPISFGQEYSKIRFYAHNLWLDVWKVGGIIPFISLVIFSIINLISSIKLLSSKMSTSIFFKSTILVTSLAFLLVCFVEPIFEGSFVFVLCYFIFSGMTTTLKRKTLNYNNL